MTNSKCQIRNFSIIAHIDHGKTTLTDRLLQMTNTISDREFRERLMDSNPIERERGITIKMAPVRMDWIHPQTGQQYQFNLIDTPGHVDFSYEVSRSLAACEGVLLVIDATQGIQAQTLANYEKAKALGLKVIPVINKIDLPAADIENTILEVMDTFEISDEQMVSVSAKTGENVEQLLVAIAEQIPQPGEFAKQTQSELAKLPPQALVFTSLYDAHLGVIAYVRLKQGTLEANQSLQFINNRERFSPSEVGFFAPNRRWVERLLPGEVGYLATGLKDVAQAQVGDTVTTNLAIKSGGVEALSGYQSPQPMVYLDLYPTDGDDFVLLQDALDKLRMHDAALQYAGTHSVALGNGMRIGFLGVLHAEIVQERLEREFNLDLIATAPSVPYEVIIKSGGESQLEMIHHASEYPDPSILEEIREPMTQAVIFTPRSYLGSVMQLVQEHRGELLEVVDKGARVRAKFKIPLAELIVNFHDQLKSVSSGFASLEYKITGYEVVDAVRIDILVHGEPVEALSQMVVREQAHEIGKIVAKKLKETIPRQQFEVPIQAAIGGKIIARETIKAYRKDVTAKLYGGDRTRRDKLLKKQKAGKARMKDIGQVQIPQEAFMAVLER